VKTRLATKADAEAWLAMRAALWPDADVDELRLEVERYFVAHGEPLLPHCVFVAEADVNIVGMLELSLRPYADGCDSSPVSFIEAWYVAPEARQRCRRRPREGGGAVGAGERLHRDGIGCAAR
jgi:aminoglycoside 6'-N-acetyltransferase I